MAAAICEGARPGSNCGLASWVWVARTLARKTHAACKPRSTITPDASQASAAGTGRSPCPTASSKASAVAAEKTQVTSASHPSPRAFSLTITEVGDASGTTASVRVDGVPSSTAVTPMLTQIDQTRLPTRVSVKRIARSSEGVNRSEEAKRATSPYLSPRRGGATEPESGIK